MIDAEGRTLPSVLLLGGFYLISRLLDWPPFFEAFGFSAPSSAAALVIFGFAFEPVGYFLSPLFSFISRRFEYQADRFAVQLTGNHADLSEALLVLSRDNLTNLTPHPWYSFFHYSHPTLVERITAMRKRVG